MRSQRQDRVSLGPQKADPLPNHTIDTLSNLSMTHTHLIPREMIRG